jgi:hypothetical protein
MRCPADGLHRTRLAKAGHAVCMPVIVTALLALLYPVHATLPVAVALAAWWAYWAARERDLTWAPAPLLGGALQAGRRCRRPVPGTGLIVERRLTGTGRPATFG